MCHRDGIQRINKMNNDMTMSTDTEELANNHNSLKIKQFFNKENVMKIHLNIIKAMYD